MMHKTKCMSFVIEINIKLVTTVVATLKNAVSSCRWYIWGYKAWIKSARLSSIFKVPTTSDEFEHSKPRHGLQARVHFFPWSRHKHLEGLQPLLHLQRICRSKCSGAMSLSVKPGWNFSFAVFWDSLHPQSTGFKSQVSAVIQSFKKTNKQKTYQRYI